MNDLKTEIGSSYKKVFYLLYNYNSFLRLVQVRAPIFYFPMKKLNLQYFGIKVDKYQNSM